MTWWEYVQRVSGGNQAEIAYKTNLSQPSIWRWQKIVPKPDNVAAFARAYDRPVIEAFIAAGYLSEADAKETLVIDRPISELSDAELVAEIERRIENARVRPSITHEQLDRIAEGTGIAPEELAAMHARLDEDPVPDSPESIPLGEQAAAVMQALRPAAEAELARRLRSGKPDEQS